jgi:hypothetical protein
MNVGESVVLVRGVDGVEEGTRGRVKDTNDDTVVVECKTRIDLEGHSLVTERLAFPSALLDQPWFSSTIRRTSRHIHDRAHSWFWFKTAESCPSRTTALQSKTRIVKPKKYSISVDAILAPGKLAKSPTPIVSKVIEERNDTNSFPIEPPFPLGPRCGSWVFPSMDAPLGGALANNRERLHLRLSL